MGAVLGWLPVVWAMRIALLVLLAGCSYLYLLLIAPFFRPANVMRMLKADIPRVRRFGAEIAGTGGELELADDREQRLQALEADMEELRRAGPHQEGAHGDDAA
jgi:hypothetical protein